MREICFRGYDFLAGEWREGCLVNTRSGSFIHYFDGEQLVKAKVIPESVGQFSGVSDETGKRIFEGDILSGLFLFGKPVYGTCEFRDGSFGVRWKRASSEEFTPFTGTVNVVWNVSGNEFFPPELSCATRGPQE